MFEDRKDYTETSFPLFVDLDGTLIKSDLLIESFLALVRLNPLWFFLVPIWILRGKAYLKQQIVDHVEIDANLLPYNSTFLEYLNSEVAGGRKLILATASNEKLAWQVADHLGIFQSVLASNRNLNLSGKLKLKAMLEECGEGQFDYAGNAAVDLQIWPHARYAILVNTEKRVEKAARQTANLQQVFEERATGPVPYLKAMRVHQWLKNLLLFVPLLTAHEWHNILLIFNALIGFLAFSLCASSVYLLNDLLDLPSDRGHPRKRKRPFAAGDVPFSRGGVLMLLLLFMGLSVAAALSWAFLGVLLVYLAFTLAYSLRLKAVALIDVLILAGLYTLRVIAGAAAIDVVPSFWLLAFSMFVFLSLALVKRCSELDALIEMNGEATMGRDYRVSDLGYLHSMGTASGYLSVLVLALFINSPDVTERYTHPELLWLLCPTILYWISRIWLKTRRGEMHDDPLIFAIRDRGSRFVLLASVLVIILAL